MIDVQKANQELQEKTYEEIQTTTAYTWASRAIASYLRASSSTKIEQKIDSLERGIEYEGESLEHAGLASPELLTELKKLLYPHKVKAKDTIKKWKMGDAT